MKPKQEWYRLRNTTLDQFTVEKGAKYPELIAFLLQQIDSIYRLEFIRKLK